VEPEPFRVVLALEELGDVVAVVADPGNGWDSWASTTCWPALRPDVICVQV
jgi:hypothetical protein